MLFKVYNYSILDTIVRVFSSEKQHFTMIKTMMAMIICIATLTLFWFLATIFPIWKNAGTYIAQTRLWMWCHSGQKSAHLQPMRGSKTTCDNNVNIAEILRISLHAAKKQQKPHQKYEKVDLICLASHCNNCNVDSQAMYCSWCNDVLKLANPNICRTSDKCECMKSKQRSEVINTLKEVSEC